MVTLMKPGKNIRFAGRVALNAVVVLLLVLALIMNISLFTRMEVLAVISGSMEPALPYASLIVIRPELTYEPGDIVTFISAVEPIKRFTHRIVSIEGNRATTRGDANNADDPEPSLLERAEGKVILCIPLMGYLVMAMEHAAVKVGAVVFVALWCGAEAEIMRRRRQEKLAAAQTGAGDIAEAETDGAERAETHNENDDETGAANTAS
jgi:signal peptidase